MTFRRDKRDLTQFLQDILEAIDDIEGFVKEMEFNEFSGDKKTIYAVMKPWRSLEKQQRTFLIP
jgi:uncharacterized protein with HEPN domain